MKNTWKFFDLLTHKTWERVTAWFRDPDRWGVALHFILFNAGYVLVMAGLLYLTFQKNNEVLTAADPVSIILMIAQTSFILAFISLFVMGCEEALIRKVFSRNNPHLFDELFEIQKEMQNILMGLLSVLAVVAAVYPSIAEQLNRILLFCGIILFACILVTSLYDRLFLRGHAIEEILKDLE